MKDGYRVKNIDHNQMAAIRLLMDNPAKGFMLLGFARSLYSISKKGICQHSPDELSKILRVPKRTIAKMMLEAVRFGFVEDLDPPQRERSGKTARRKPAKKKKEVFPDDDEILDDGFDVEPDDLDDGDLDDLDDDLETEDGFQ